MEKLIHCEYVVPSLNLLTKFKTVATNADYLNNKTTIKWRMLGIIETNQVSPMASQGKDTIKINENKWKNEASMARQPPQQTLDFSTVIIGSGKNMCYLLG